MGVAPDLVVPDLQLWSWRPEQVLLATVLAGLLGFVWPRPRLTLVITLGLALATGTAAVTVPAVPVAPLGAHFLLDGPAALTRLVLLALALAVQLVWRPQDARAGGMLVLAALGVDLLAQAATLGGLLVAVATTALGGGLAAWFAGPMAARRGVARWLGAAGLGFGVVAFAGTLWCGAAGTLELAALPSLLAARPSLPPLALPVLLSLAAAGLALALLGEPGRFQDDADPEPEALLVGWLSVAPALALAVTFQRLAAAAAASLTVAVVPALLAALASVLVVGGFLAAMAQDSLPRRLAWAASGQAGLAMIGFLAQPAAGGLGAPVVLLLALAPAQVGAMMLARELEAGRGGPRWREPQLLVLTVLLVSMAAVPPLASWRPRVELLAGLQARDHGFALTVAALGTLLALVVYLQPLVRCWRLAAAGEETPPGAGHAIRWAPALPTLLATALMAAVLGWGLGLFDPAALLR